ncbi:ABC transporter ATP-binding protein [Dongia sedimenti]|uniref:Spermidine/putrescine import ATP-binding protein PotA n=1 Tax=Dongia sedimenti TaxID=3064282 RepID=A0ABU0YRM1_9PROT|nr:ABC transporter ATP-binding protein [Rhodospirillaceae bacterium R-7]
MAAVVTISHLVKKYGAFTALSDVSLTVGAGEFLTLLGPSGSGKTTLLMSLAGFADPDSGSIRIGDREIMGVEPHKRNIGMVFQSYALFPHMTVGENVAYPLKLRGVGRADREDRSRRVLSAVQMPGYENRRIDQLSGGQRQRVAVARAIVFEPDIILMDEPLSALDKKLREELQIELKHLHRRLGSTIIYVTHDQKEALTLSDRIAVMNRGQIVQIAKPQEMYEHPASAFVADFIGYSLLLPIARSDSSSVDKSQLGALADNPYALLVVRPEKLDIVSEDHRQPGHFYFTSEVKDVVYQGDIVMVYARLKSGEDIVVRRDSRFATLQALPRGGSPMRLALHQSDTSLVTDDRAGVAPLAS